VPIEKKTDQAMSKIPLLTKDSRYYIKDRDFHMIQLPWKQATTKLNKT